MIEHIDCSKELIWITLDARAGPFWAWDKIRVLGSAWPCLCTFSSTPARQQGSLVSQTGGGFFLFTLCPFQPFSQIGGVFFLFTLCLFLFFPNKRSFFLFSFHFFPLLTQLYFLEVDYQHQNYRYFFSRFFANRWNFFAASFMIA